MYAPPINNTPTENAPTELRRPSGLASIAEARLIS
jgi:hypothetical protein